METRMSSPPTTEPIAAGFPDADELEQKRFMIYAARSVELLR
jgi:hypothetical protein